MHSVPEKLRSCARVQTLRSDGDNASRLCMQLLQDGMPVLQTLQLTGSFEPREDPIDQPLEDLPLIRHLIATWWQPPSDAAWLVHLKELVLSRVLEPDMELLRVLSACANLEQLTVFGGQEVVEEEFPETIPLITLPRLRKMRLEFKSDDSAMKLFQRLIFPQSCRRILRIDQAPTLGLYVADYRRLMSLEESYIGWSPKSADVLIEALHGGTHFQYKAGGCLNTKACFKDHR
ncbi:hypothetical protein FRC01_001174 [Tulasnella sp. 417]|nr:hypothetical protein FRC01_001174 [Tulasnella sp. 417]